MSDERRTVEVPIEPEQLPPHGRRTLLLFALIAVAVVGTAWIVLSQRVLKPPVRGDVVVDSVVAIQDGSGQWDVVAVWSAPVSGGCVALGWQSETSDRGYEVASSQLAPDHTGFPAVCATPTAGMVIERLKDDPTGTKVAVNGVSFVVARKTEQIGYTTGAVSH